MKWESFMAAKERGSSLSEINVAGMAAFMEMKGYPDGATIVFIQPIETIGWGESQQTCNSGELLQMPVAEAISKVVSMQYSCSPRFVLGSKRMGVLAAAVG